MIQSRRQTAGSLQVLRADVLDEGGDRGGSDAAVVLTIDELFVIQIAASAVVLHGSHVDEGQALPAPQFVPMRAPPNSPPARKEYATVRGHRVAAALQVVEVLEVAEARVAG